MTSLTRKLAGWIFWRVAETTSPFGGIRPRRVMHWLGKQAAGAQPPEAAEFRWCRDRGGNHMRLHPYYLIDRHIISFGEYEAALQRLLADRIKPGMICMDVGANIGAITVPLGKLCGPTGHVFAFEPNPLVATRLRENVAANRLSNTIIQECALSNAQGTLSLAVTSKTHENQGMSSLVEFDHADLCDFVQVPVRTLDDFVDENKLARIDFIKIDIQGAEPHFLQGATKSLKRFCPTLAIELAPSSLSGSQSTATDIVRQLNQFGLIGYELSPNGQLGTRIDADTLPLDYGTDNAIFVPSPSR